MNPLKTLILVALVAWNSNAKSQAELDRHEVVGGGGATAPAGRVFACTTGDPVFDATSLDTDRPAAGAWPTGDTIVLTRGRLS